MKNTLQSIKEKNPLGKQNQKIQTDGDHSCKVGRMPSRKQTIFWTVFPPLPPPIMKYQRRIRAMFLPTS